MQRRLAKDASKAEQAQKEIYTFGYPLYEYLAKMKKCSYLSLAQKVNRFGVSVKYIFFSDRRC